MADVPQSSVQMRDFPGLVAEINTLRLPSGASDDQVNVVPDDIGRLKSRRGYAVVRFDVDTEPLVGFFNIQGTRDFIVLFDGVFDMSRFLALEDELLVDEDGNYVVG